MTEGNPRQSQRTQAPYSLRKEGTGLHHCHSFQFHCGISSSPSRYLRLGAKCRSLRQGAASLFTALEDRRAKLKSIQAPTVVVHGAEDPIVPVEAGRDVAASIPGAELRIIPGMGHDIPVALVEKFVDAITTAASRANGSKKTK